MGHVKPERIHRRVARMIAASGDAGQVLQAFKQLVKLAAAEGSGTCGLYSQCVPGLRTQNIPARKLDLRAALRIGEEAHRGDGAGDQRKHDHPERGLFIAQRRTDAVLHARLAEGQRTGRDQGAGTAAVQQCLRIVRAGGERHVAVDSLVAGQLDVPAQQHVGQPQHGVEPVDRQQQEAQRLPPVVAPHKMRALVGEHMGKLWLCKA